MNLNFAEVLATLGPDAAFRVASEARPPEEYLFARFLPEITKPSYHVEAGDMTVRPTMAAPTGMDSPYAKGGQITLSTFLERSAKLTNSVVMREEAQRQLQEFVRQIVLDGGSASGFLRDEALAFLMDVVVQGHLDTMEYLRGQALSTGALSWTYNNVNLSVDYGVPAGNKLTTRTVASTNNYGGAASKFWEDVRAAQRLLRYRVAAVIAHPDTIDEIVENSANDLHVINQGAGGEYIEVQRHVGSTEQRSGDTRDRLTIYSYGHEGEVLDPANPGSTVKVEFINPGKVVFIGQAGRSGYRVGQGSQTDLKDELAVGYTHIGPTVEGGGRPGRWANMYVPQQRAYELVAEGVTNGLPVIENPDKVVILTTELA